MQLGISLALNACRGGGFPAPKLGAKICGSGENFDALGGNWLSSRNVGSSVIDHFGNIIPILPNEIGRMYGRRVHNIQGESNDFSDAQWIDNNATHDPDGTVYPTSAFGTIFNTTSVIAEQKHVFSGEVRWISGNTTIHTYAGNAGISTEFNPIEITSEWKRFSHISAPAVITATNFIMGFADNNGSGYGSFQIRNMQIQVLPENAVQAPDDYIGSDEMGNAGVNAVRYFNTTNGNSIAVGGEVIQAVGTIVPTTPKLLDQPESTNMYKYSNDYANSVWVKQKMTIHNSVGLSTRGFNNAILVREVAGGSAQHFLRQDATTVGETQYTLSFFARKFGSGNWIQVTESTGFGADWQNIDLDTGNMGNGSTSAMSLTAEVLGNGWTHVTATMPTGIGVTLGRMVIASPNGDSVTRLPSFVGSTSNGFLLGDVQLEEGLHANTPMPTTLATVTRTQDNTYLLLTDGINFNQNKMVSLFRYRPQYGQADLGGSLATILMGLRNSGTSSMMNNTAASGDRFSNYDGTNSSSVTVSPLFTKNQDILVACIADGDVLTKHINYSDDGGVTWKTWGDSSYDGAYQFDGHVTLMKNNPFAGHLQAVSIHTTLFKDDVSATKAWIEAKAKDVCQ